MKWWCNSFALATAPQRRMRGEKRWQQYLCRSGSSYHFASFKESSLIGVWDKYKTILGFLHMSFWSGVARNFLVSHGLSSCSLLKSSKLGISEIPWTNTNYSIFYYAYVYIYIYMPAFCFHCIPTMRASDRIMAYFFRKSQVAYFICALLYIYI